MQPFQAASEVTRRSGETPLNLLNYAGQAAIGGGLASAGSRVASKLISKIGPWLSPYIPEDLAVKGLNKVDPRIGKFIKKAQEEGAEFDEIRGFFDEKMKKSEPEDNGNPIQKYSPELFEFLNSKIKEGLEPIQAGAIAQQDKKFLPIIKKLTEDYKSPFSNILETVFGLEGRRKNALSKFNEKMKKKGILEQERERFDNSYGQKSSPNQQGSGQEALLEILKKIQQVRGN